jgi:putative flavoprotein involved in K+ transport
MRTTAVVIGAGHAGLAMSRRLTERSIDHVVLERGEVANSWRAERWPSLRLLTPNWQTRLPGYAYDGPDPDGYLPAGDVASTIAAYSAAIAAPVRTHTTVLSVRAARDGYCVATTQGEWTTPTVVLASGACNLPVIPPLAATVAPTIAQVTPFSYRGATALHEGGVLVVGASATGVQLAEEIQRSGRSVTLAVGGHVRLPRTYRGRDIFWWMEAAGVLDQRYDDVDDIVRARHVPSPQLIGSPARSTLDLNALRAAGIRVVGRLGRIADGAAQFSGSLANACALADLKMNRLLNTLDDWARAASADGDVDPPERYQPTALDRRPTLELDLGRHDLRTIVWATGYRPDYGWLDLPVLDRTGHIRHDGGVVLDAPGVYLIGAPFLRRRRSSFIHGAVTDSGDLAAHLHSFVDERAAKNAAPRPAPRRCAQKTDQPPSTRRCCPVT